jgi:hypothetical protein
VTTGERRLSEVLPAFSHEINAALQAQGEAALAAQISRLRINSLCTCGDDFCAMFYAVPEPEGPWGPGHTNVEVDVETGMVILDVVDGKITAVEALYRPDVKDGLARAGWKW